MDDDLRLAAVSPRLAAVLGGMADGPSLIGTAASSIVQPTQASALNAVLAAAGPDWTEHVFGLTPDPSAVPLDYRLLVRRLGPRVLLVGEPDSTSRTEVSDVLLELNDELIRDQRRMSFDRERLDVLATTDPLTGLGNRRLLDELLPRMIAAAERSSEPLSVAFADIDRFKMVNDTYGHPVGDQVLKHVGAVLKRKSRGADFVVRFGGEEFVAVLPRSDRDGAAAWAERVRAELAAESSPPAGVTVTLSFGVARLEPGETASALLARADAAVYEAKRAGRDRVVVAGGSGVVDAAAVVASRSAPPAWAGVAAVLWASSAIGVAEFDQRLRLVASNRGFERLVGDPSRIVLPVDLVPTAQRGAFEAFLGEADDSWRRGLFGIAPDDESVPADRVIWARRRSDRLELVVEMDADLTDEMTMPLLELVDDLADTQRTLTRRNRHLQRALDALQSARSEVRELRRFIPVCAWCRRIQVDGDGSPQWLSLEEYLARDETWVTHSMCDSCAAGLQADSRPEPPTSR